MADVERQGPDLAGTERLRSSPDLRELSSAQRNDFVARCAEERHAPGDVIVEEGVASADLYFLTAGEVEVTRRDEGGVPHVLNRIGPGEWIGELSLIGRPVRSATARAATPATTLRIPIDDFEALADRDPAFLKVRLAMAVRIAERARALSEATVEALARHEAELERRKALSGVTINTIALLCVFTFSMNALRDLRHALAANFAVTLLLMAPIAVLVAHGVRRRSIPLATIGLTLEGWRPALREAIPISLLCIALATLAKWILIRTVPAWAEVPLFNPMGAQSHADPLISARFHWWLALAIYVLACPLQEILARGVLQGSLERLLTIRHRRAAAVLLASLIFGTMHLYDSGSGALWAMIPGLLWGWMYARHRTLVGVSISHAMIGGWVLFALGKLSEAR